MTQIHLENEPEALQFSSLTPRFLLWRKKCIWSSNVTISKIIWALYPSQICPLMWFGRSLYPVHLFYSLKFCYFVFSDSNMMVGIWMHCIISIALSESVHHLANIAIALCARLMLKVKYNNISWFKWLSLSQLKCRAVPDECNQAVTGGATVSKYHLVVTFTYCCC